MAEALVNGVSTTLNGAITNSQTTITIATADIAKFPASPNQYRLAVTDGTNTELLLVTGGQGTATLTVTRHAESYNGSSSSYAFASGSTVAQVLTSAGFSAMSGGAMVSFGTVITSGSATEVVFSSIPQTCSHLELRIHGIGVASGPANLWIRFNGDTGSHYTWRILSYGFGGPGSYMEANDAFGYVGDIMTGGFGSVISIVGYAASSTTKQWYGQTGRYANSADITQVSFSGTWFSGGAITAIRLYTSNGTSFTNGSIFSLYGLT